LYFYSYNHRFLNTILTVIILISAIPDLLAVPLEKTIRIEVWKEKRLLQILENDRIIREMTISLGRNPIGAKTVAGDNKTPEGEYIIDYPILKTDYYKAFHISYPDKDRQIKALKEKQDPGGGIWIHGIRPRWNWLGFFHTWFDWTHGCIALTNEEIDELFRLVPIGTKIRINP
jgi:murein L,D-transpeptidase YafK